MKQFIKNFMMEFILLIIAIVLIIINPDKAINGVIYALKTLLNLSLVIIGVAFLTGYISEVVTKKTISKFIGHESGLKGMSLGVVFGTMMVGPAFAFYPFFAELIREGASVGVVAATIAAWSVKIQWMPLALSLLDVKYVLLLNFFIILFAFFSGIIMNYLFKKYGK
ncbi:hypothetical protein Marpi_0031 [Marinitoga piezophila KA3]|uniref:Permease n=1 Tax=Marinitoga piezophila (strain DSM 14283 / JCM 11233 / KA3) TaxID=443254 RepID=H2J2P7_MARPK|nr:hypothetical protein [Marinitoga piezophila]AEX84491.1 hypothetical protein Marpi_0031 [Marinitoga piezophila KA3]